MASEWRNNGQIRSNSWGRLNDKTLSGFKDYKGEANGDTHIPFYNWLGTDIIDVHRMQLGLGNKTFNYLLAKYN